MPKIDKISNYFFISWTMMIKSQLDRFKAIFQLFTHRLMFQFKFNPLEKSKL
jgi:hypothetical protein